MTNISKMCTLYVQRVNVRFLYFFLTTHTSCTVYSLAQFVQHYSKNVSKMVIIRGNVVSYCHKCQDCNLPQFLHAIHVFTINKYVYSVKRLSRKILIMDIDTQSHIHIHVYYMSVCILEDELLRLFQEAPNMIKKNVPVPAKIYLCCLLRISCYFFPAL